MRGGHYDAGSKFLILSPGAPTEIMQFTLSDLKRFWPVTLYARVSLVSSPESVTLTEENPLSASQVLDEFTGKAMEGVR